MPSKVTWYYPKPLQPAGVLVACSEAQEWILPWWWRHYSAHNTLPVLFVDLGLSPQGREWCEERGTLAHLPALLPNLKPREALDPSLVKVWENAFGNSLWSSRPHWVKKPFALLQTPFEKTLWLDLDCEVRQDLTSLFFKPVDDIALVPEEPQGAQAFLLMHGLLERGEVCYNSGVIYYRHGSLAIQDWAEQSFTRGDCFFGDQNLLSRLLFEKGERPEPLSQLYNWRPSSGENPDAIILHWVGDVGKAYIQLSL
jgi:hypothetical protein